MSQPIVGLRGLFKPPVLRNNFLRPNDQKLGIEIPRSSSSSDLIFDFVFSAGLSRVASAFRSSNYATSTAQATWFFYIYFQPLYWQWLLTVEWLSRFDTEDWGSKLFLSCSMTGVIMYSMFVPNCIKQTTACQCTPTSCAPVFFSLVALRVLIIFMYVVTAASVKKSDKFIMGFSWRRIRSFCVNYAANKLFFLIMYLIAALSVYWTDSLKFPLWEITTMLEMLVWLALPLIGSKRKSLLVLPPLHVAYVTERLRRFVLISMSTMVTAVLAIQEKKANTTSPFVFIFVALCPFVILPWQVFYFDIMNGGRKRHALRVSELRARIYICLHSVLVICITIVASTIFQLQLLNNQELPFQYWFSRRHYGIFIFALIIVTVLLYLCHSGEVMASRVPVHYRLISRICSVSLVLILAELPSHVVADRAVFFVGLAILLAQALGESAARTERPKDSRPFTFLRRRSRLSAASETEDSSSELAGKESEIADD